MKQIIFVVAIFVLSYVKGQENYSLSKETIVYKGEGLKELQEKRSTLLVGVNGDKLIYQVNNLDTDEVEYFISYNLHKNVISDSIYIKKEKSKIFKLYVNGGINLYRGYYNIPEKYSKYKIGDLGRGSSMFDYQDFWVEVNEKEYLFKTIKGDIYDNDFEINLDYTGRYIIYNTYISEDLRSTSSDSLISIYDLDNIKDNNPIQIDLTCKECINMHIINENLFYGKKEIYDERTGDYYFNVYKAPKFDLLKEELLAVNVEVINITNDGRFILGKRELFGKQTYLILDVKNKSFQYILGRDYLWYDCLYSINLGKFIFETDDKIIIIDYPNKYPFSSIGEQNKPKFSTDEEDNNFWKKYQHSSRTKSN